MTRIDIASFDMPTACFRAVVDERSIGRVDRAVVGQQPVVFQRSVVEQRAVFRVVQRAPEDQRAPAAFVSKPAVVISIVPWLENDSSFVLLSVSTVIVSPRRFGLGEICWP